jgi:hypothetical protein
MLEDKVPAFILLFCFFHLALFLHIFVDVDLSFFQTLVEQKVKAGDIIHMVAFSFGPSQCCFNLNHRAGYANARRMIQCKVLALNPKR